ncbi:MAG: phospholipid transport system transporter-binding protein [Kangiellaceae bacterium]
MKLSLTLPSSSNSSVCLLISGELDQATLTHDYWLGLNESDKQALINAGHLKVDLANVERTDTAGLAWLINLVKDAKTNKVKVSFESVPDKLLNLADLSSAKNILTQ